MLTRREEKRRPKSSASSSSPQTSHVRPKSPAWPKKFKTSTVGLTLPYNAGIAHTVPAEECTDDWLKVVNINLNAVFYCCREFGKVMLAQGHGSIINMASMSGIISNNPQPQCAYNAAKQHFRPVTSIRR
jgi:NADP-dependent 3-hydroxy acid dehydrogenase YdfG